VIERKKDSSIDFRVLSSFPGRKRFSSNVGRREASFLGEKKCSSTLKEVKVLPNSSDRDKGTRYLQTAL